MEYDRGVWNKVRDALRSDFHVHAIRVPGGDFEIYSDNGARMALLGIIANEPLARKIQRANIDAGRGRFVVSGR